MVRLAAKLDIFDSYFRKESRLSSNIIIYIASYIDKRAIKEIITLSPWDSFSIKILLGMPPFFALDS